MKLVSKYQSGDDNLTQWFVFELTAKSQSFYMGATLENESVDLSAIRDLIKQVRGYTGSNQVKADFFWAIF